MSDPFGDLFLLTVLWAMTVAMWGLWVATFVVWRVVGDPQGFIVASFMATPAAAVLTVGSVMSTRTMRRQ